MQQRTAGPSPDDLTDDELDLGPNDTIFVPPPELTMTPEQLDTFKYEQPMGFYNFLNAFIGFQKERYTHLRLAQIPADDPILIEKLLENLTFISKTAQTTAQHFAIEQIENGKLSRIRAAELLGVHQGTVARWLKGRPKGLRK